MFTKSNNHLQYLIVIGTSTGGPHALTVVMQQLSVLENAACLIVQHMPAGFTVNLAKRLNQNSAWTVSEARDGEPIKTGHSYLAPGGLQMSVLENEEEFTLAVSSSPPVNGHRPSVDVLFRSVVKQFHGQVIGVLMTGMGRDGAVGLGEIKGSGGYTLAESESTCVVYGMPKVAFQIGATHEVVPLHQIAEAIEQAYRRLQRTAAI